MKSAGVRHPLAGPDHLLEKATLERMHEAAVEMLAKTGIQVENREVREAIAKRKGFRLSDGRIRIERAPIESLVRKLREAMEPAPRRDPDAKFGLGTDTRASWIVDEDGRSLRPMTRRDVIDSAKLITMLGPRGVSGTTAGMPTDVPAPLMPLEQYMIAAEFSPRGGAMNDVTDVFTAGVLRDMNRVYGRGFGRSVWNPSPMILGGPELDVVWHYRDEIDSIYVGSMPAMGMSGPCDPVAVFTLAVAECMGGAVILAELLPKAWVQFGPHPEPADMASGAMVLGSPEWDLLDVMHRDVHGFYGLRSDYKLIHTTASVPGVQAAADHAGSMMLGAGYGYTHFTPAGMLALDEVYSPAMLVLDAEIVAHTERICRGVWSGEGLDLKDLPGVVAEAVAEGGVFAGHDTTVLNMRSQYHSPKVLKRLNRAQWQKAGKPDEVAQAQAEADRLIASFNYEPPRDKLKELRSIYEKARKQLAP